MLPLRIRLDWFLFTKWFCETGQNLLNDIYINYNWPEPGSQLRYLQRRMRSFWIDPGLLDFRILGFRFRWKKRRLFGRYRTYRKHLKTRLKTHLVPRQQCCGSEIILSGSDFSGNLRSGSGSGSDFGSDLIFQRGGNFFYAYAFWISQALFLMLSILKFHS